ncbi:FtsB family cell division protein [Natronogracilivirga saccharolytica]|uniref:Septum formation initiator family protein n=1 Tax=Natronogracilivirga saccharolytica TaxID=2812953 RepID=A0A8J7RN66_9BACT|nr:septum formation initiator family protein [Natronogracilivirga saccharolytica]MBP3192814.1 septum formation initiator family protein [Natronogracilivirga saccharolytica]
MNLRFLNPLRWKRPFLFGILILMLILWFGFFDTFSVWTRMQLNNEKKELIRETEQLQTEATEFREKMEALESDPDLLQTLAREEYGMRKPGEIIYRVQEK